jgi:hypothetical protein
MKGTISQRGYNTGNGIDIQEQDGCLLACALCSLVETDVSKAFRVVFWDILPCKMIVDRCFRGAYCVLEAVRTSETSVDNHFTRQYIPEDNF